MKLSALFAAVLLSLSGVLLLTGCADLPVTQPPSFARLLPRDQRMPVFGPEHHVILTNGVLIKVCWTNQFSPAWLRERFAEAAQMLK